MNKKNKNLLIIGGVTLVLIITLAVSYAFFSYNREGNMNSKLIVGDIYMKFKETTTVALNNAMPSDTYLEDNYFEFSIDGKNTNTKYDIWYDISLNHGDPSTNENRTIRLDDKFLHFRLVEVIDGNETELIQNETYNSLDNKRIYVNTIPANTNEKVTHNYRLYMWIGNEVMIGNTANANYSMEDWDKVYASIKVNVTGDFNEKELNPSTPESCFATSDNGDGTVTLLGFAPTVEGETTGEAADGCLSENFVIPSTINGKQVTKIASWAFSSLYGISRILQGVISLEIPNSVTTIGDNAFSVNRLTSVVIPDSVTTIGNSAFSNNQLTSVEIPNSVTYLSGFSDNQLTSVEIPNSVTTIGESAFLYNQLTSVEIPNSVTTIGSNAFYGNQLTSVEIPNSVTTIEVNTFSQNQLTSVEIPNSVTTIESYAFYENQLTSVEIPNSVTTIESGAFAQNQLTSVTIGNGITSIGCNAFSKSNRTSVGNGVTYYDNPNLSSITIDKSCNDIKNNLLSYNTNYYPWLSYNSPYTASGVTIYGSNNEVCDTF